ncbi:hypothetical protein RCG17_01315 [Neobacillus sp. PS3-12]|jgi:hypothetical protein|nr:hypothetical protein [Neobacillus sp. PS3-12]WML53375.1 hypothetical protein RCG17_01315 [Neobacillus sp. PS3-12]
MEEENNIQGAKIAEKRKKEFREKYRIIFSPSTMARVCANKQY